MSLRLRLQFEGLEQQKVLISVDIRKIHNVEQLIDYICNNLQLAKRAPGIQLSNDGFVLANRSQLEGLIRDDDLLM